MCLDCVKKKSLNIFQKIELVQDKTICVIGCHLAAHQEEVKKREENLDDIWNEISFENNKFGIDNHDFIFLCGDMNFRVNLDFRNAVRFIKEKDDIGYIENLTYFSRLDQLKKIKKNIDSPLYGFKEHALNYMPTFKFFPDTDI